MTGVVTISERKTRATDRLRTAADRVMAELRDYASSHDGRFLVFGSVAAGRMHHASDFDVMVDFDREREPAAIEYVESVCRKHGIRPDIHTMATSSAKFLARIGDHMVILR
jgi:predicted nucleotidyltransferase